MGCGRDRLVVVNQQLRQPRLMLMLPPEIPCCRGGLTVEIRAYRASEGKMSWRARGIREGGSFSPRGRVKDFRLFLDADSRLLANPTLGKKQCQIPVLP